MKTMLDKVHALNSCPTCQTRRQICYFVSLAGYYCQFIPNFTSITAPLTDLLKGKDTKKFSGSTGVMKLLIPWRHGWASCLSLPTWTSPGNAFSIWRHPIWPGSRLFQDFEGEEHPILRISRKLVPRKRTYSIIEKEALAIKWAELLIA